MLNINIATSDTEVTSEMREFAQTEVQGLLEVLPLDKIKAVRINLRIYKHLKIKVELIVSTHLKNGLFKATLRGADYYTLLPTLVDKVTERIRHRLEKVSKEKRQDYRRVKEKMRVKHFPDDVMTPDEAVERMEDLGHNFFSFTDFETGAAAVVYKRHDPTDEEGDYGLILHN